MIWEEAVSDEAAFSLLLSISGFKLVKQVLLRPDFFEFYLLKMRFAISVSNAIISEMQP